MNQFFTHAAGDDTTPNLAPRWPLVLLGLAAISIAVAAYLAFNAQKREIKALAERNLADIAALKADQVGWWWRERRGDAAVFSERTAIAMVLDNWMRHGRNDGPDRRLVLDRMDVVARLYGYAALVFFDSTGQPRLSTGDKLSADPDELRLVLDAMRTRQIRSSDLHADPTGRLTMGLVAPMIVGEQKHSRVAGAMYFRIDPAQFLYPLIESWPVQSRTAETLLVRRDGDDVLYLNRLRHANAEPFSLRLPMTNANADILAVQLLRGKSGVATGLDYRGKKVVGYLVNIPHTNWGLVAKIDEEEIYAPIRRLALYFTLVLLLALSFFAFVFWSLRMHNLHIQREYQAELANRLLAKRLSHVQDEERRKLGAELHDRTAANLASVDLLLKQLAAKLPESESAMYLMDDIGALIADTNHTIREISTSLHPPLLDYLGLESALNALAAGFARRLGIPVQVHAGTAVRTDRAAKTVLYRIAQEALANCAKHAQAKSIHITLAAAAHRALLTIADDGVGFEPAAAMTTENLGMLTMREHASEVGGRFSIVTAPGRGTTIRAEVPCMREPIVKSQPAPGDREV